MNATPRRPPPPPGSGPTINLTPEQFRQLIIAAVEDSPRAREIVRQAFLPAFPTQGANPTQDYICKFDASNNPVDSKIFQSGTTRIGIFTASPSFGLDVDTGVFAVGPKASSSGNGGTMRFRDDTGTERWVFGLPGSAASQDFHIYNYVNGHEPVFIANGAPSYMLYADGSGHLGIGTIAPLVRLDARGSHAKATTASFENILQAASTDSSNPLALRAGVKTDSTDTNRYGAIEVDDNGTKRPLALQPSGGGVVIGGTLTKQASGGPELLSFQHSDADHVAFAGFVGSETNFRFGASVKGFMEWGPGSGDQDVAFFRNWAGGFAVQSFNGTTSDHAFAVQKPTTNGSVGADLFRVDTASNLAVILGKLGVNLSSPNFDLHTSGNAVALGAPNAAPTDANLNASNISFWLDETNNNLKIRLKYSNGTTVKTATIALT